MSDGIQIDSNVRGLIRDYAILSERGQGAVRTGIEAALLIMETKVRTGSKVRFSGARSGLASRLTSRVIVAGNMVDGVIGFRKTRGFPYELAQEFGAKAKPGKAMAMPVSPEARRLSAQGKSARDFPRTLTRPGKARVLIEWKTRAGGKGGGANTISHAEIHYVLLKSIPPRLRFRENVLANAHLIGEEVRKRYFR